MALRARIFSCTASRCATMVYHGKALRGYQRQFEPGGLVQVMQSAKDLPLLRDSQALGKPQVLKDLIELGLHALRYIRIDTH